MVEINKRNLGKNFEYENILYLDTGSITQNQISSLQTFHISNSPSRAKRLLGERNIVYSMVRPIQRHFGFIENPPKNLVVSTGFIVIEEKEETLIDLKYLYYFLSLDVRVEYFESIAEGSTSTYPSLKPSDISELIIPLPPLEQQKEIAEILSSFDDKIDFLHRQNKTLESLNQIVFTEWFVNQEKNEWWEIELGKYLHCTTGYSYKSLELGKSKNALVNLKNFSRSGDFRLDGLKEFVGTKYKETQIVKHGDLVVAHTDITQEADIIGNPILVIDMGKYEKLIISMDLMKVESGEKWLSIEFLYYLFKTPHFKQHCLANSNGTTVLHMNRQAIPTYKIKIPNIKKIEEFTMYAREKLEKKHKNLLQIATLKNLQNQILQTMQG